MKFLCMYCGHKFELKPVEDSDQRRCPRCGDDRIKGLSTEDRDVYGYNAKEGDK